VAIRPIDKSHHNYGISYLFFVKMLTKLGESVAIIRYLLT